MSKNTQAICTCCGEDMYEVDHIEEDGFDGRPEPYYECANGCDCETE